MVHTSAGPADYLGHALGSRQGSPTRNAPPGTNLNHVRRPTYLFSGLTKCGVCGSGFTMFSKDRLACAGARDRGIGTNTATIRRDEVERRVLKAMEERLWNQELFEEFCQEFTRERNRLHGEATAAASAAVREQIAIDQRLTELVEWICTGEWRAQSEMAARVRHEMAGLEQKKIDLAATIAAADREQRTRPLLHPEMGKLYRDWVIEARDGLNDVDRRADATAALRGMVEEIVFTPEGGTLGIVLKGNLAAMLAAASPKAEASEMRRQVTLVAGGGFEPPTFGL